MKTRRPLFTPVVLALLVWVTGGLVWGGTPAFANTLVVPISGTVDGLPESVSLSGTAEIRSALVTNDPGTPPDVILRIKLLDVSGPGQSGTTYIAPAENIIVRPLGPTDFIEMVFPFFPSGSGGHLKARSGRVTFTLGFDVQTGDLTGVTASLRAPSF